MAKPEWGRKRTCQVCGKKYYDLNKSPMICPSCGAHFDTDLFLKNKKSKTVLPKVSTRNENDLSEDISNIDDIEASPDSEVVTDDDPLLEINKEDQKDIAEDEIKIDDDIAFIDDNEISDEELSEDDDISDENGIDVEISEEDKK
tara:strand:- start:210 stop:644 length:435 start_codon:yes stop_codon:yes gene_type:complete